MCNKTIKHTVMTQTIAQHPFDTRIYGFERSLLKYLQKHVTPAVVCYFLNCEYASKHDVYVRKMIAHLEINGDVECTRDNFTKILSIAKSK